MIDAELEISSERVIEHRSARLEPTYYTLRPKRKVLAEVLRRIKRQIAEFPLARRTWYYLTGKRTR